MKRFLLSLTLFSPWLILTAQTTHQVCVTEVAATGNSCTHTAIFTPANLTINVGDRIEFTTFMVALTGYNGTHDIQFSGSPTNNVLLPISTNITAPITSITTPPFNTPGTFAMECKNSNHCFIADLMSGWSCTGYSVTVNGTPTDVKTEIIKDNINIYPNPSNGIVNIELAELQNDNPTIYLIDVLGKVVETIEAPTQNIIKLNTSFYKKGSYYVKIISNNYSITKPIVLN